MRKLRPMQNEPPAQGYTASQRQSWDFSTPRPVCTPGVSQRKVYLLWKPWGFKISYKNVFIKRHRNKQKRVRA